MTSESETGVRELGDLTKEFGGRGGAPFASSVVILAIAFVGAVKLGASGWIVCLPLVLIGAFGLRRGKLDRGQRLRLYERGLSLERAGKSETVRWDEVKHVEVVRRVSFFPSTEVRLTLRHYRSLRLSSITLDGVHEVAAIAQAHVDLAMRSAD